MRRYQGDAIDKTKGVTYTPPPKKWSKPQRFIPVPENATEEELESIRMENERIKFENSICCNKHAYFFGYVYPKRMTEYKEHKRSVNLEAKFKFGLTIDKLIKLQNKTPEQKLLVKNYYKYSPLFNSKCTMNTLARYVEDIELAGKSLKPRKVFDYKCLMSCDPKDLKLHAIYQFRTLFKRYNALWNHNLAQIRYASRFLSLDEVDEMREQLVTLLYEDFRADAAEIISDEKLCANYLVEACYNTKAHYRLDLLWYNFGDILAENVKNNSIHQYRIIENPNGTNYFGVNYTLVDDGRAVDCSLKNDQSSPSDS